MDEVMEYIFFDLGLAEAFKAHCIALDVQAEIISDETPLGEASYSIQLSDAIEPALIEKVEEIYEEMLFGEQAALIEGNDENGAIADSCGIQIQLKSRNFTNISIQPDIMNKLLSVLSEKELQRFLEGVADDIENPKIEPICSRVSVGTI